MDGNYTFPQSVRVKSVLFYPGATNDIIIIKQGSDSGDVVCQMKSADGEHKVVEMHGAQMTPYIDHTNSTLSAGSLVIFYCE